MSRGNRERGHDHSIAFGDEPRPSGEDWEECGGQLLWVAGYTEGGAPYGLTTEEFRRAGECSAGAAGWARAKVVLRDLLQLRAGPPTRVDVGFVRHIARGLSRDIFAAEVELTPEVSPGSGTYSVSVPRTDADGEVDRRARKELRLVGRLSRLDLSFKLPEFVGAYPDLRGLALVSRFVRGVELELRAGRWGAVRPWELLGEIMAAIHRVDSARFADILPGSATRLGDALEALRVFDGLEGASVRDARAWAEAHLPPAEPATLVHGDLLGQNILLDPQGPPTVIDWEYARRGDPARELAIVTRGVKRPFQIAGGLDALLDAYHRHGGARVTAEHVTLQEMCLAAGWYREALAGRNPHPPHEELARLRRLLHRVEACVG